MGEKINIKFVVDNKELIKTGQKFKEIGEKVTGLGTRISAAFTLPLVGMFAALSKNEAFASALKPIQDAFGKIFNDLAVRFIPLLQQLQPYLLRVADALGKMFISFLPSIERVLPSVMKFFDLIVQAINWVTSLSEPVKNMAVNFFLFGAVLGPVLMTFGQILWTMGTFTQLAPGMATGIWSIVTPLLAVGAAIFAIIKLVQMEEFKKVWAMFLGGATLISGGSRERADAVVAANYKAMGGGQASGNETGDFIRGIFGGPSAPQSQAGGAFQFVYAPGISTASQYEAEQKLKPMIEQIIRQGNGRK